MATKLFNNLFWYDKSETDSLSVDIFGCLNKPKELKQLWFVFSHDAHAVINNLYLEIWSTFTFIDRIVNCHITLCFCKLKCIWLDI